MINRLKQRLKKHPAFLSISLKMRWRAVLRRKRKYATQKYIEYRYAKRHGRKPDLDNPKSFTEKLQWIKLWYNDPRYTQCTDKVAVREYVRSKGLGDILNECYGVYESPSQIDLDALPDKFAIKANHGCGWNLLCSDKDKVRKHWKSWCRVMNQWMRMDFSLFAQELHYARIPPRLICERFLEDGSGKWIPDYKFFCFGGEPRMVEIDRGRFSKERTATFFDMDFAPMQVNCLYPADVAGAGKTANWERMKEIARILSAGFPHVRVDLYEVAGRIYFGELTFTDGSGYARYEPDGFDCEMGSWLELPGPESPYTVYHDTRLK